MKRIHLIVFYIFGCCVLHNVSLLEGAALDYEIVIPEVVPQEIVPLEPTRIAYRLERVDFRRLVNQN